jgi:hypothetical protein
MTHFLEAEENKHMPGVRTELHMAVSPSLYLLPPFSPRIRIYAAQKGYDVRVDNGSSLSLFLSLHV